MQKIEKQHIVDFITKKLFYIIFLLTLWQPIFAQQLYSWRVQDFTFLDNREYFNPYGEAKTIIGTRLDLTAGFHVDSQNILHIGGDALYEFGSHVKNTIFYPTLYYEHRGEKLRFLFGAFPRVRNLNYPRIMHNDTLQYYRPNLEGALMRVKLKKGYQKAWIDWTGRQTETEHESFMAGTFGRMDFGRIYLENYYYMFHYAGTLQERYVRDNGGALLLIGYDLQKEYHLDFSGGLAFSDDRVRPDPFYYGFGFYSRLQYKYKIFQAKLTYYNGMPVSLKNGDALYKAGTYMRLDADLHLINRKNIQLRFEFSGHFIDFNMDESQKLLLFISLDNDKHDTEALLKPLF